MTRRLMAWGVTFALAVACGRRAEPAGDQGPQRSPVEAAFAKAAAESGVPWRYLLATGFLESRLAPEQATSTYVSLGQAEEPVARGTILTQTAFGVPLEVLGLPPGEERSFKLETQVEAYARWVAGSLKASGVTLPPEPRTAEEHFYWIENLALLHRRGVAQRRNVQVIFARELIQVLNQGFLWQDPRSGERLELPPQGAPLDLEQFPQNARQWLQLSELDSQIYVATYLPLVTVPSGEFRNKARRIEVIHCPLTLSACLELQTRSEESDVRLAAHYIIPADKTIFSKVVQVADHSEALILTNVHGENVPVQDAVVIMLVGNSGRPVQGVRQPAVPTWFTDGQLRAMGQVINDVCTLLSQKDPEVKREVCMGTEGDRSVRFRHQARSEEYRWGDIADFDATIFNAYVRSPTGLGSEVAFEADRGRRAYKAGEPVSLAVLFDAQARGVELERLSRCQNGKVVWEPIRTVQVRGQRRAALEEAFFDSGPNQSGDQFFRVRVYGKDTRLLGWAIQQVFLEGFEGGATHASEKYCDR